MTPKDLFLKNKHNVDQLSAVTRSQWFKACLVSVRAQVFAVPNITEEHIRGALLYEAALLDLPEELPEEMEMPDAGRLQHDLDTIPKPANSPKQPKKSKSQTTK